VSSEHAHRGDRSPGTIDGRERPDPECLKCVRRLVDSGLPAALGEALCERMWRQRMKRGQVLYVEGNRATHFYAVHSGRVKLVVDDRHGREHITAIMESGDLFGFESLFGDVYEINAETLTDGELCVGDGDRIRQLLDQTPTIAIDLSRYLHRQLRRIRARQAFLGASSAHARVAGYILHRLGSNPGKGELRIPNDLTLKELGGMLGLSPETVCRMLGKLKAAGTLELGTDSIRIRVLADLHRALEN